MSDILKSERKDGRGKRVLYERLIGIILFVGLTFIAVVTMSVQPSPISGESKTPKYANQRTSTAQPSETLRAISQDMTSKQLASQNAAQMRMPGQPIIDANTFALYHF